MHLLTQTRYPGPSFFLKGRDAARMADMGPGSKLEKSLKNLGRGLAPKALLVITAHWEANEVTVSTGTYKKLLSPYLSLPNLIVYSDTITLHDELDKSGFRQVTEGQLLAIGTLTVEVPAGHGPGDSFTVRGPALRE